MVNREQEVMDRVQDGHIATGQLKNVFELGTFEGNVLNHTDVVFEIDASGHHTHAAANSDLLTPIDEDESFDLFKLQDEEPMDALDSTKEPPADWEPGPEDVVDVDAEILADPKWEDLQDGL